MGAATRTGMDSGLLMPTMATASETGTGTGVDLDKKAVGMVERTVAILMTIMTPRSSLIRPLRWPAVSKT